MALQLLLLDVWGMIAALFVGVSIYIFGGTRAFDYIALMLVFLFTGTIVTMLGKERKERMGLYEYGRSWQNVLSNSVIAIVALALGLPKGYFGAIAAATADKFSSEVGALGEDPTFLLNFERCEKGTSGAISPLGTIAGIIGAEIIGISSHMIFPGMIGVQEAIALAFIGFFGSFADTLAGILESRGVGNKSTSNIIGSLVGALLAIFLI